MTTPNGKPLPRQMGKNAPSLESVTKSTRKLPNRAILFAGEGWGKTSFAAQAPRAVFIMTRGEDGLLKLMENGIVPPTAHFPECVNDWLDLKTCLHELIVKPHDHRMLVIDTVNGADRLCHEHVCQKMYGGDWGEKGFMCFSKGYEVSMPDWLEFLQLLDRVRDKGMSILLLSHASVERYPNPEGPDYDRFQPALNRKHTWSATAKWLDLILYGCLETFVEKENKIAAKGKATGGVTRLIKTEASAAYVAKNRHNLPAEIECGTSPQEAWNNFTAAFQPQKASE